MYQYKYPRPMVCVDVVLFERRKSGAPGILLIRRGKAPFAGRWALPGGFVEMDEDLDAAARRELKEETAVDIGEMIQVGAFGNPKRDPRGRNISVAYASIVTTAIAPAAGDDAADARVFSLNELPELAFDHDVLIESSVEVLKQRQLW